MTTKIRSCRLRAGLSMSEAARRIGVTRQRYLVYEQGETALPAEIARALSAEFHVSIDELFQAERYTAKKEMRDE